MDIQIILAATGIAGAFCTALRYVIKNDTRETVNGKLEKVKADTKVDLATLRTEVVSRSHYANNKLTAHELQLSKLEGRTDAHDAHFNRIETHVGLLDGRVVSLERGE